MFNPQTTLLYPIERHLDHVPLILSSHRKRLLPLNNPLRPLNQRNLQPFPRLFHRPISFLLFRSANVLLRSCFWFFSR